ncbi:MAG: hypothetical protein JW969_11970 [Spirochaetales bacterium]|nr:hypothetical protein [Spirochaetales bacterium]
MADKSDYDRLSLTLPKDLNDWLHHFRQVIKDAGGFKLPRTLIVRAFIRAVKESKIKINLQNIRDNDKKEIADKVSSAKLENILVSRLIEAIKH